MERKKIVRRGGSGAASQRMRTACKAAHSQLRKAYQTVADATRAKPPQSEEKGGILRNAKEKKLEIRNVLASFPRWTLKKIFQRALSL